MTDAPCPADEASEGDRAFFEAHPHRRHRVRSMLPGEFGPYGPSGLLPAGAAWFVAVRWLGPKARARVPFAMHGEPSRTEGAARTIFEMLMRPAAATAASTGKVGHA